MLITTIDDEPRAIGRRLQEIRRRRGMPLKAVVDLAGISAGYLARLERGERSVDRRSLIKDLATALGIAPQDLTALPVPAPGDGAPTPGCTRPNMR